MGCRPQRACEPSEKQTYKGRASLGERNLKGHSALGERSLARVPWEKEVQQGGQALGKRIQSAIGPWEEFHSSASGLGNQKMRKDIWLWEKRIFKGQPIGCRCRQFCLRGAGLREFQPRRRRTLSRKHHRNSKKFFKWKNKIQGQICKGIQECERTVGLWRTASEEMNLKGHLTLGGRSWKVAWRVRG